MIKEHYSILFCSLTGNTKKLPDAIYETLLKDKCDYFGTNDSQVPQSDVSMPMRFMVTEKRLKVPP